MENFIEKLVRFDGCAHVYYWSLFIFKMFLIFLKVFYYFFCFKLFFEKLILKIKKILFSYILTFLKRKINKLQTGCSIARVWGVVAVAFQSIFHSEKHANNVFLFFKNYF